MKKLEEIIEDYKYIASSFKDSAPESFEITLKYIRQAHQSGIESGIRQALDCKPIFKNVDNSEATSTIIYSWENAIKSLIKE